MINPDELRTAVKNEVSQQMTPIYLKLDRAVEDVKQLRWTVYGDALTGEDGLVKSMKHIAEKLDTLVDESTQRKWMQRGIAVGLGLNLAASTGILGWLEHLLKSVP